MSRKRSRTPKLALVAVLALALAAPSAAFAADGSAPGASGSQTIERDGSTAETVITGKVGRTADVISVVLPATINMNIKTDDQGHLDQNATEDVEVDVVNESKSTHEVDIELYETVDDGRLLNEVNLHLNGQNINRAIGGAAGEVKLVESLSPGSAGKLVLSASPLTASQTISEGARSVRVTVKATVA